MNMKKNIALNIVLGAFGLAGCETVINPELQKADPMLVVDAWVNTKPGAQRIDARDGFGCRFGMAW